MSSRRLAVAAILCAAPAVLAAAEGPELREAVRPLPETALLDVGIVVFDPGVPAEPKKLHELESAGIFAEVREAEARYIPVHLGRTLQRTGFWGAVRVVPGASAVDLTISGTIRESTGAKLSVDVLVVDARGKVWLDRRYKEKPRAKTSSDGDRFQSLYVRIANDLAAKRSKLDGEDVETIRTVSFLRFAADLAPAAFSRTLRVRKNDRYTIERLPARDDPMTARVERLRSRDAMFIDTVDAYYGNFYAEMRETYDRFRSRDYWERQSKKSSRRSPMPQGGLGLGSVSLVGSRVEGSRPVGDENPVVGVAAVCGTPRSLGSWSEEDVRETARQSAVKTDVDVLRELGASLAANVAPLVVEVEGKVTRLTGTVEAQYTQWRVLLREIFAEEVGLPALSR